MATKGNKNLNKGIPKLKDAFIVIIKTEWNSKIVNQLENGVIAVLKENNINYKTIIVPGAIEIPFALKQHYTYSSTLPSAYITLGTVIKGDTPHFDYVCKFVTEGILQLNLSLDVPVVFGVLTVNTEKEATERTTGSHGNKGEEFAITAIKMIALNNTLKKL
ncbi:MAG TPA: 6,7-dimethyl-8-ribityllumazine synthase [Chitinophagaceae bacterium]|nr:6,7-dimethyl-8-ribityllumazine synthase [Chitinophagaceae bacterium]MCC6635894.1 6,7-dimethyl-8-ribityllumazine synthase [Chitinophagaceae bacterium]HMZ46527.1 6,7-dimethyl-8-ribityllumazine synthase [Chitinophagaceae bacterium]HNE93465.1 6,7-dimethyl-8-ribityllumazine synthase [Chitinophagaceae bacterium]HNF29572.1 6,7-dimethyl-8-ribityllumazine synthase [Chitinophagaceae bacterium]